MSASRSEPTARAVAREISTLGVVSSPPVPSTSAVPAPAPAESMPRPRPLRPLLEHRGAEADHRHEVTVIVPTRNEQDNVAPLVAGLGSALRGRRVRVVFVDDSDDATPQEVVRVSRGAPF